MSAIIQEAIEATRIKMDFEEASILWPKIQEFIKTHGREPSKDSNDPKSVLKRLGQELVLSGTEQLGSILREVKDL